ncbi:hypothetical protein RHGRI_005802 [Rhododendron griersonianum]|uniref:Uncharacterized protein n=1 Tax=Rhododendron griersonianum TaxID=479676 RepID=A0AAV6LDK4_9ERIC|nr:hypothetical protein RHGRI_005802 [Rhododendron griersonianum]
MNKVKVEVKEMRKALIHCENDSSTDESEDGVESEDGAVGDSANMKWRARIKLGAKKMEPRMKVGLLVAEAVVRGRPKSISDKSKLNSSNESEDEEGNWELGDFALLKLEIGILEMKIRVLMEEDVKEKKQIRVGQLLKCLLELDEGVTVVAQMK